MNTLNDSLADLLDGPIGDVRSAIHAPANYQPKDFSEPCRKCSGTGLYRAPSTHGSRCFACKGQGKLVFKTSPDSRAKAKASSAARKDRRRDELVEAFKAAQPVVYAWLLANVEQNGFATSLWNGLLHYGSLTDGQVAAVERSIAKAAERKVEAVARVEAAPVVDTAGIDRLKLAFDTAIARASEKGLSLRMPKITIGAVVISPAKATSKNPGALYVKQAGQYLGKISGGKFFASYDCADDQKARVLAFVADPQAAAKAYGIETGVCCICNATLTSKWRNLGIGPICSQKFGW